ncbi:MAG: metal ABC transporter substrate-binding protein [bacterium]
MRKLLGIPLPSLVALLLLPALSALPAGGPAVAGEVNVVASVPDLGDMASRIGGDRVKVTVLASGREDLHGVPVRPSFIPKLHKADLLLSLGLDAEHAWLPALAADARNNRIREGREGWIEVYPGIGILGAPQVISRAEGEQHPQGNPHFNIGPQCGRIMAGNVARALAGFDPDGAGAYEAGLAAYLAEIEPAVERLRAEGAPLQGVKVISYHADIPYLAEFYGMEVVGTLEPKPGIEPSAGHLAELATVAATRGVRLVIHNQAQPSKLPGQFAERIGAADVMIGNMAGALEEADTWLALQRYNLRALLAGLESSP